MLPCRCGSVWCSQRRGGVAFPGGTAHLRGRWLLALIHAGFLCDRSRSTSGMEGTDSRSRPCLSSVQTGWAPPAPPRSSLPCRSVWVTEGQLPRVQKGNIHAVRDVALAVHTPATCPVRTVCHVSGGDNPVRWAPLFPYWTREKWAPGAAEAWPPSQFFGWRNSTELLQFLVCFLERQCQTFPVVPKPSPEAQLYPRLSHWPRSDLTWDCPQLSECICSWWALGPVPRMNLKTMDSAGWLAVLPHKEKQIHCLTCCPLFPSHWHRSLGWIFQEEYVYSHTHTNSGRESVLLA